MRAGQAHTHLSEFEQAEQALNRARVVLERSRTLPDHAFYLATCLNDLGNLYRHQGKNEQVCSRNADWRRVHARLLSVHADTANSHGSWQRGRARSLLFSLLRSFNWVWHYIV